MSLIMLDNFYSKIGVREVLYVDRDPWRLQHYCNTGEKLELAASCGVDEPAEVDGTVIPFSFQLLPAEPRPTLQLTHQAAGRTWRA